MIDIRKLESELWEAADDLRANSKLTSNQYCMPVLGLIFLRYAHIRFKAVEAVIMEDRPVRGGVPLPVTADDFREVGALYLPPEARYDYLVSLSEDSNLGEAVNYAMELVEGQSKVLSGVLPRSYTDFSDDLLSNLLRIFNNETLEKVGGDVIGRIYEYFLSKFAPAVASDDGVFFTPKSLVQMIVNVIEPKEGILLDPACGSGGMFVQTGEFVGKGKGGVSSKMTFYGQEKVDYNAKLCLMNLAVHGLSGSVAAGNEANSFYHDVFGLEGRCDYVMANPPFNVDKVKAESCEAAGRLPFGMVRVNDAGEVSNANYLWISYFYSYLHERGRAGFVMASSATDSGAKEDKAIRESLVQADAVDVIVAVGQKFFYTKTLPCNLWFFDRAKGEAAKGKTLFLDARNYFHVIDRNHNDWTRWQLSNLSAIVYLYRGEVERYAELLSEYEEFLGSAEGSLSKMRCELLSEFMGDGIMDEGSLFGCPDAHASVRYAAYFSRLLKDVEEEVSSVLAEGKALSGSKKRDAYAAEVSNGRYSSWKQFSTRLSAKSEELISGIRDAAEAAESFVWLYEKFGDGVYADIPGFCYIADASEIAEKKFSLNPGSYVGVPPIEFEEFSVFQKRMQEIHAELSTLQAESIELMQKIERNFEDMGL